MAALENFIDQCESFAAPVWGLLGGCTAAGVYIVKKDGHRVVLPPGMVIETVRQYVAVDNDAAVSYIDLVDLDLPAHLLKTAAGKALTPAVGDRVIRGEGDLADVCVVVKPRDIQCYERVGAHYIRVHCERMNAPPAPPVPPYPPPEGYDWAPWVRDGEGRIFPWLDPPA